MGSIPYDELLAGLSPEDRELFEKGGDLLGKKEENRDYVFTEEEWPYVKAFYKIWADNTAEAETAYAAGVVIYSGRTMKETNAAEAFPYFAKAAELGSFEAADILITASLRLDRDAESRKYLMMALEMRPEDPKLLTFAGNYYYFGIGGPKDLRKSIGYLRKAAEKDSGEAQFRLYHALLEIEPTDEARMEAANREGTYWLACSYANHYKEAIPLVEEDDGSSDHLFLNVIKTMAADYRENGVRPLNQRNYDFLMNRKAQAPSQNRPGPQTSGSAAGPSVPAGSTAGVPSGKGAKGASFTFYSDHKTPDPAPARPNPQASGPSPKPTAKPAPEPPPKPTAKPTPKPTAKPAAPAGSTAGAAPAPSQQVSKGASFIAAVITTVIVAIVIVLVVLVVMGISRSKKAGNSTVQDTVTRQTVPAEAGTAPAQAETALEENGYAAAAAAEQSNNSYIEISDYDSRVEVDPEDYDYVSEYYVRCNGDMRIRSGPGLDYNEITMLNEARMLVLATREVYEPSLDYGDTWGFVQYFDNGGGYGWCYLGFTHREG